MARFQYHFENGNQQAVLTALTTYQNTDGGFGHALEADAWNPNSSPIQTWTATEILREIGFTDREHPIITGILRYLESGADFEGKFWYNMVKSNNDYPHAPWWHTESDSTCHNDYNPTACLAGVIIRFADKGGDLYALGCRIAREAFAAFMANERENDMHTLTCFVRLLEYCREAGATDVIDLDALEAELKEHVAASITKNTAEWETSYGCKPSQFFNVRESIFFEDNREIAEYEYEFIMRAQLEDGSWPIPWSWNDYPEQWAISKNWWRGSGAILNLLYLRGMGRLK